MIDISQKSLNKYLLFGSLYFIQGIILALCYLIIPIYLVEKGFPLTLITIVIGIIAIPWSIKFCWGIIIDYFIHFGRKIFVILGGIQFSFGLFAVTFMDPEESLILFAFFLFLSMSGVVLLDVAIDAWAIEISHENDRGKISGSMFAGQHSGRAFSFIFLAFIANVIGYNFTFFISALIIIVITFYVFIFKEVKTNIKSKKIGTILISEFKKKTTQYISFFLLISFISSGILTLAIPLYTKIVFNLDITQMGLIFAVFPIATAIGSVIGGTMVDKYGKKIILSFFISLSLVFSVLLIFITSWEMLVIFYGIINFLYGCSLTVYMALMMDITNPRIGGFQFSFLTSITNTGGILGETICGSIVTMFGFIKVFLISAWFLGPVLLMLYLIKFKECVYKKTDVYKK